MVESYVRLGHPRVAAADPSRPTSEEAMAIASGSIAYTDTYSVDENTKTIHVNVGGACFQILLKLLASAGSSCSLSPTK
jgi:hypothetical protein